MPQNHFAVALRFFLLIVFLAVQGTPAHAHLSARHDHSGERHQHNAEVHTHQALMLHSGAIDSEHIQSADAPTVDLGHDATSPNHQFSNTPAAISANTYFPFLDEVNNVPLPFERENVLFPIPPHVAQPRAPPLLV